MTLNLLSELTSNIDEIRGHLERGDYPNESAIRVAVVDPMLRILGWNTVNPTIVKVEYTVSGKRVDYALCNQESRPLVFIEAKAVGKIDDGEMQLVEYAYYQDIPITILTDGEKWRFYLAGGGNYKERLVQELDLRNGDAEANAKSLIRYLSSDLVLSGESSEAIREDHRRILKDREIEKRLPDVWDELIQENNSDLVLAIMQKSEEKGIDPTESQILAFLKILEVRKEDLPVPHPPRPIGQKQPIITPPRKPNESHLRVTMPDGEIIENHNSRIVFTTVIEKIGLEDVMRISPNLVSRHPFANGKHVQIGEYYINTNNGTGRKEAILKTIATQLKPSIRVDLIRN